MLISLFYKKKTILSRKALKTNTTATLNKAAIKAMMARRFDLAVIIQSFVFVC